MRRKFGAPSAHPKLSRVGKNTHPNSQPSTPHKPSSYPSWVAGNNTYDEAVFATADAAGTRTLGLWTNFEGVVGRWWEHMTAWVANQTAVER